MKKINNAKRLVLNLLVMAFLLTTIVPVFAEETMTNTSAIEQKQIIVLIKHHFISFSTHGKVQL